MLKTDKKVTAIECGHCGRVRRKDLNKCPNGCEEILRLSKSWSYRPKTMKITMHLPPWMC